MFNINYFNHIQYIYKPFTIYHYRFLGLGLWCLTSLSTIFHLYRGSKFYWWRKPEENHRPGASHCQTLWHNVASSTLRHELYHYTIHHTTETHHYNTPMLSVCHSISILYYKGIRIYLDHERTRRRIWQNRSHWIRYLRFDYYHRDEASAGTLLTHRVSFIQ